MPIHRKHTPVELSYLAGFIDGDGFIIAHSYCPRKNSQFHQYNLTVGAVNTNKEVLDWIKKNFGGCIQTRKVKDVLKHKVSYSWRLQSKKAEKLLKHIYPYLKIKKPQARVALEFRKTFDLSKYIHYENGVHIGNKVPDNLLNKRLKLREQLKFLNQRGPTTYAL